MKINIKYVICKKPMLVLGSLGPYKLKRHNSYSYEKITYNLIIIHTLDGSDGYCRLNNAEFSNTFYSEKELRKYKLERLNNVE